MTKTGLEEHYRHCLSDTYRMLERNDLPAFMLKRLGDRATWFEAKLDELRVAA